MEDLRKYRKLFEDISEHDLEETNEPMLMTDDLN